MAVAAALRRSAAATFGVLAVLGMLASTVTVWIHVVALDTERAMLVARPVLTSPALSDALGDRLADRMYDAAEVERRLSASLSRLGGRLPDLAGSLAQTARRQLRATMRELLGSEQFTTLLTDAVGRAHAEAVRLIRVEPSSAAATQNGPVELDLAPVVSRLAADVAAKDAAALGLDPTLGDLLDALAPAEVRQSLSEALVAELGPAVGPVRLLSAHQLSRARGTVGVLDRGVWVLVALTVMALAGTMWLAVDRMRALALLAAGTVLAAAAAIAASGLAERWIPGAAADLSSGAAQNVVFQAVAAEAAQAAMTSLRGVLVVLLSASGGLALAAAGVLAVGRRRGRRRTLPADAG